MDSKHLSIGALALSLGFAALADAKDTQTETNPEIAVAGVEAPKAACNGECNGECGSGSGDDTNLAACNGECNGECGSGSGDE